MKLGIVGLPNVGKSTLFNAITSTRNAEAANYPFCTIEPNSGIVAVPDARLDKLAEVWQTNKKTPAIVEFVDIAGLVKGASQGAGLGNKFLGHIRECDAIVHVVRCFDDDNIIHVVEDVTKAEAVDPLSDIDVIDYELILSDLEVVQNRAGRMAKAAKSGNNKAAAAEASWLEQLAAHLSEGKPARSFDWESAGDGWQTVLREMGLLSAKPVLYACNVGEDDLMEGIEHNRYVPLVAQRAAEEGAKVIPICARTEEDIADYTPEEKKAFLAEMGIEASGLDNLITASYDLLGLISFLTDGKKECRAWTIRKGTKAPQAAGKIHSDFERGFIRASVIHYPDLEANGFDYAAVKSKGPAAHRGQGICGAGRGRDRVPVQCVRRAPWSLESWAPCPKKWTSSAPACRTSPWRSTAGSAITAAAWPAARWWSAAPAWAKPTPPPPPRCSSPNTAPRRSFSRVLPAT